jgi:hypothetical protein
MRASEARMSDIGSSLSGPRCSPPSIVELSPSDIARRRLANWGAIQADTVSVIRREMFEYSFQARRHLLIATNAPNGMIARPISKPCQNRPGANSAASSASCPPDIGSPDGKYRGCRRHAAGTAAGRLPLRNMTAGRPAYLVVDAWASNSHRRAALIVHAGAGTLGQPISTTHPDPGTIVRRKPCSLTIAATRLRPSPRPVVCAALSDR